MVTCGSAQFKFEPDPLKLTGVRSVGHTCLIWAMGMTKRPIIWHDGTCGLEMANDKVSKPQEGDQGQVGGPQMPLLSHGSEIESPNWAWRDYRT